MNYISSIITLFLLLFICTEENKEPLDGCIETASMDTLLLKLDRPSIDTLKGFMEISDTVRIEEKLFKYSIFLPKTFDTVFKQPYSGCTYSTNRTLFTNRTYAIEPEISTNLHRIEKDDSLFYVAIAHDTVSNQIIDKGYVLELKRNRKAAREAAKATVKLDASYRVTRNKTPRMITERVFSDISIDFELQLILHDVLFKVNTLYEGELAMEMREKLKIAIESFEVEQL
jgi:hypothetical protein